MVKKRTEDERTRRMLRSASTKAGRPTTIGGVRKTGANSPKPVTLPKLQCLEDEEDNEK